MINAKRLDVFRNTPDLITAPELLELVTAYEAARELAAFEHRVATGRQASYDERDRWVEARRRFLTLFPEPTK